MSIFGSKKVDAPKFCRQCGKALMGGLSPYRYNESTGQVRQFIYMVHCDHYEGDHTHWYVIVTVEYARKYLSHLLP